MNARRMTRVTTVALIGIGWYYNDYNNSILTE